MTPLLIVLLTCTPSTEAPVTSAAAPRSTACRRVTAPAPTAAPSELAASFAPLDHASNIAHVPPSTSSVRGADAPFATAAASTAAPATVRNTPRATSTPSRSSVVAAAAAAGFSSSSPAGGPPAMGPALPLDTGSAGGGAGAAGSSSSWSSCCSSSSSSGARAAAAARGWAGWAGAAGAGAGAAGARAGALPLGRFFLAPAFFFRAMAATPPALSDADDLLEEVWTSFGGVCFRVTCCCSFGTAPAFLEP